MNGTLTEATLLVEGIKEKMPETQAQVIVCPPFTALDRASQLVDESPIRLGAQTMDYHTSGAFTGEISPLMLEDFGVSHVILGHSERRAYYGESDQAINQKISVALDHAITPILCVGESLEVRQAGQAVDLIQGQLQAALEGLSDDDVARLVIAYEPIWAIGTGQTATSQEAEEICGAIRTYLGQLYSQRVADQVPILYGGSVKPDNAAQLMSQPNIDGALVGGAALQVDDFVGIIQEATKG